MNCNAWKSAPARRGSAICAGCTAEGIDSRPESLSCMLLVPIRPSLGRVIGARLPGTSCPEIVAWQVSPCPNSSPFLPVSDRPRRPPFTTRTAPVPDSPDRDCSMIGNGSPTLHSRSEYQELTPGFHLQTRSSQAREPAIVSTPFLQDALFPFPSGCRIQPETGSAIRPSARPRQSCQRRAVRTIPVWVAKGFRNPPALGERDFITRQVAFLPTSWHFMNLAQPPTYCGTMRQARNRCALTIARKPLNQTRRRTSDRRPSS